MKKSAHSESEMVKAFQELENGVNAETAACTHGISKATFIIGTVNTTEWM